MLQYTEYFFYKTDEKEIYASFIILLPLFNIFLSFKNFVAEALVLLAFKNVLRAKKKKTCQKLQNIFDGNFHYKTMLFQT